MARKVIIQQFGKNKQFVVTIPRAAADTKGWKKGDIAYWSDAGRNSLILSKEEK